MAATPSSPACCSRSAWLGRLATGRRRLKPADVAPAAWLDGSAGGALNRALRLPAQDTLNTWNASLRYRLLGDLGDQVAMGCPGWLFYRDGLRPGPACMCSTSACA